MVLNRNPDFRQLGKVLAGEIPDRFTPFEFMLNERLYQTYAPEYFPPDQPVGFRQYVLAQVRTFARLGYDAAVIYGSDFRFPTVQRQSKSTVSLNDGALITDRASFECCPFSSPAQADTGVLDEAAAILPEGMKLIICGPCGVLENVIALVGYKNLCMMMYDDEKLTEDVFAAVGSRLTEYYAIAMQHPAVGALMSNDDWGFKTQTMLSTEAMRRYVFPWHKEIVATAHRLGKPAILHSCGYFDNILEDIITDMRYDARHSYEDAILPVEKAYERMRGRIAVLGGIDLDFLVNASPAQITERSSAMLRRTARYGGYALGTGNSVPEYVPHEHYMAMHRCVEAAQYGNCPLHFKERQSENRMCGHSKKTAPMSAEKSVIHRGFLRL